MDAWAQPGCSECPGHCCRTAWVQGHRQHLPEAPDTPRHLPLIAQKEIFFHPMLLFLPLKEHVGKLFKSKSFFGFAGAGDECSGFLGVEIVCINFLFCEAEQNLLPFHPKAAGAGKHSQHEQAQCSFIIPVCIDGFNNFSRKTQIWLYWTRFLKSPTHSSWILPPSQYLSRIHA